MLAGIETVIDELVDLRFDDDDVAFLAAQEHFSDAFLERLAGKRFSCDVWAMRSGTPVFGNEPCCGSRARCCRPSGSRPC